MMSQLIMSLNNQLITNDMSPTHTIVMIDHSWSLLLSSSPPPLADPGPHHDGVAVLQATSLVYRDTSYYQTLATIRH